MHIRKPWLAALAGLSILLASCGGGTPRQAQKEEKLAVPESYQVRFETTKGDFIVDVTRAWAPEAADRFYLLVKRGFYDEARFFRVLPRFIVQFGINGDPAVENQWRASFIPDDPVKQSNTRGTLAFAKSGPNTRTTQVFINVAHNTQLDKQGFAPFATISSGMDVVGRFYSSYGDAPPAGNGPKQELIETQGNVYLEREFPRLDYIKTARVISRAQAGAAQR